MTIADVVGKVGAWHRRTFGQTADPGEYLRGIARKALEEARGLQAAPEDPGEIADLFILACGAADRLGIDLQVTVMEKLGQMEGRADMVERARARGAYMADDTPAENALRMLGYRPLRDEHDGQKVLRLTLEGGRQIVTIPGEGEAGAWDGLANEMMLSVLYQGLKPHGGYALG